MKISSKKTLWTVLKVVLGTAFAAVVTNEVSDSIDMPLELAAVLCAVIVIALVVVELYSRQGADTRPSPDRPRVGRVRKTQRTARSSEDEPSSKAREQSEDVDLLALDLGTVNTRVCIVDEGVVVDEPSVVAVSRSDGTVMGAGEKARQLLGRAPTGIDVQHPVQKGVVVGTEVAQNWLAYILGPGGRVLNLAPDADLAHVFPSTATSLQRRTAHETLSTITRGRVLLVPATLAAALGSGIPAEAPRGRMVACLGGGVSEVGVVTMGGVVNASRVASAGADLDQAIIRYVAHRHRIAISHEMAENAKIQLGYARADRQRRDTLVLQFPGQHRVSGEPATVYLSSGEVEQALQGSIQAIARMVEAAVNTASPELLSDIAAQGILLTGGTALLPGLDQMIARSTGLKTRVAEDPLRCAVKGALKVLTSADSRLRSALAEE